MSFKLTLINNISIDIPVLPGPLGQLDISLIKYPLALPSLRLGLYLQLIKLLRAPDGNSSPALLPFGIVSTLLRLTVSPPVTACRYLPTPAYMGN